MSHESAQSSPTSIRVAAVAVLAAFGLLASACSSSTAGTGSTSPAAAAPTASIASVPAAGSSTSVPAVGSSTSAGSSAAAPSDSGSGGANLGGGSFCDAAKKEQAQSQKEAGAYSSGDPAALEKLETDGLNELKLFVAIAPSAIKSDVEVIASGDQKLFDALKAANFMIQKVDQSVLTSFNTPAFMAAEKHITTYLATSCGITASSTP